MKFILLFLVLLCTISTAAAWANSDSKYYQTLEINNTGINLTDYSYNILADTQSLISAGKMNLNGSDVRFYDSDDITSLWHWNESAFNQTNTSFWVDCSSLINTSNTTIYMYYGDVDAVTTSNISETFLFGDDFESGNLNQWDEPTGGTITSTAGEVYAGTYAVKTNQDINNFYENLSFGSELVIEANVKPIDTTSGWFGTHVGPGGYDANSRMIGYYTGTYWTYDSSGFTDSGTSWSGYKKLKIIVNSTTIRYYTNGTLIDTTTDASNLAKLIFYSQSGWIAMDNVFIRKYAEIEPTYSFGIEETQVTGVTYYVNNSWSGASNSNTGLGDTNDTAWLTIQKAADTMIAGDTVYVMSGTYNEKVSETTSGTVDSRIIYIGQESPNLYYNGTGYTLQISGSYITVTGFNITAYDAVYDVSKVNGIVLPYGSYAEHVNISNNYIWTESGYGIQFGNFAGNDSIIQYNEIHTGHQAGIVLYVSVTNSTKTNVTIINNTIYADENKLHRDASDASGIWTYWSTLNQSASNFNVSYNKILHSGYTAIKIAGSGHKINYNEIGPDGYVHNAIETTMYDSELIGNRIYDTNLSWAFFTNMFYPAGMGEYKNLIIKDNIIDNGGSGRGLTTGGDQHDVLVTNFTINNFNGVGIELMGYEHPDYPLPVYSSDDIMFVDTTLTNFNSTTEKPITIISMGTRIDNVTWGWDDCTFMNIFVNGTYTPQTWWLTNEIAYDVNKHFEGTVHVINSNKNDVLISNDSSVGTFDGEIIFYYYSDVQVVDTNGNPINDATVTFMCNDSSMYARNVNYTYEDFPGTTQNINSTVTETNGHIPNSTSNDSGTAVISDFRKNLTSTEYFEWNVSVEKDGFITNSTVIKSDSSWYRSNPDSYQNTTVIILSSSAKTDDFESYPIGSFNNTGQSNWSVKQGTWQIISNETQKLESSVESRIEYSNYSERNYNVSADIVFNSTSAYIGMFTRWDGSKSTGYVVSCGIASGTIKLYTQTTSTALVELESESFNFNPYQEYELKVQMNDSVLTVYIDNTETLNYTDYYRVNTIISEGGTAGLYHSGGSVYFDNFSVTTLTENVEYLNYFDYTSAGKNSVNLKWSLSDYTTATIDRGTDIDAINTEIYHGSGTSYTDSSLSTDTNYYYSITYDNSTQGHIIKAFTYDLPSTRKYVAFGDSISTAYGTLQTNESFPYFLNETIAANVDSDITHSISAITGYTTNGIIFGQLADIITEKPTFITLMAGFNDFNLGGNEDNYHANFNYIVNESTKHGIDCFILKMINTSYGTVQPHVGDTNVWMDSLGQEYVVNTYDAVDLIPFDDIIQGYNSSFYQDGVHPNVVGTINLNKSIYDYMISENYFDEEEETFVVPIAAFVAVVVTGAAVVSRRVRRGISGFWNRRIRRR